MKTTTIRPSGERGRSDFGWLDSRHTFSFGGYDDPAHRGFHSLRVINDDRVAAGMGFGKHPHRDMEILSYVVEGGLVHEDSMGNRETVRAGGVQYMSAGSGEVHSEFNASKNEAVHFLQIWILPDVRGAEPRYAEWRAGDGGDGLVIAASPDGVDGSLKIRQDARMFVGRFVAGARTCYEAPAGRAVWIQMISGVLGLPGVELAAGDGLAIEGGGSFELSIPVGAHFLLFDLAAVPKP
jgi:redox-sensitive bicupin YhaK (pirin superfamily)